MKILLTITSIFCLSIFSHSQSDVKKYLNDDFPESRHFAVPGSMLRSVFNSDDNKSSLNAVKYIEKINYSNLTNSEDRIADFNKISKKLNEQGLEEYVRVSGNLLSSLGQELEALTTGADEVGLYIKDDEGRIEGCVILSKYPTKINVIEVVGSFSIAELKEIDLSRIESLVSTMGLRETLNFDR